MCLPDLIDWSQTSLTILGNQKGNIMLPIIEWYNTGDMCQNNKNSKIVRSRWTLEPHIEGILPKGPYLSMAGRALLARYRRYVLAMRILC